MKNEVLEMAFKYADRGIPVIPLHGIRQDGSCTCSRGQACTSKGKHPIMSGWQELTTINKDTITTWWSKYPLANIGIPTGEKSDWLVLDIDTKYEGDKSLEVLEMLYEDLPATITAITGSGGQHRIFKYPKGIKVPNSVSFQPGLDIRSEGGLIVVAPSIHISGKCYRWLEGYSPFDREAVEVPQWLFEWMLKGTKETAIHKQSSAKDEFHKVIEGSRNNHLTSLAGTLRRKGMSQEVIMATLLAENKENCEPPLAENEVRLIAKSVSKYEPNEISLLDFNQNDVGNAERLATLLGNDVRYCPEWKLWLIYDGYWKQDIQGEIYVKARATIKALEKEARTLDDNKQLLNFINRSGNHSKLEAMIAQAKTMIEYNIPREVKGWDTDESLICLKNVTIDCHLNEPSKVIEIREHRRSDYITKQLPTTYEPAAACPRWQDFLQDIIPDEDTRAFIKRAVGYSLTGSTKEDVLFILHGSGCNGKSTFIQTISTLLGDYAKTIQPETIMKKERSSAMNTEIASICGARLVKTAELDEGKRLSESLVKQLTGGDTISTRHLFSRDFEYEPTYKLWISTNHKPKIYGDDDGIWRRICLIPLEVTIPNEKKDAALEEKLLKELPGIFIWALEGLMEWKQKGLKPPSKVQQATIEYRKSEDLLEGFLTDCLESRQGELISATELYHYYEWYCNQNGIIQLSSTKFGIKLREEKGFQKKQIVGRVHYEHVAIKEEIKKAVTLTKAEDDFLL